MDTTTKRFPVDTGKITIRCRARTNRIRIVILTAACALAGWLAFGLFCSAVDGTIGFGNALITPLALIFLGFALVSAFISIRDHDAGK